MGLVPAYKTKIIVSKTTQNVYIVYINTMNTGNENERNYTIHKIVEWRKILIKSYFIFTRSDVYNYLGRVHLWNWY